MPRMASCRATGIPSLHAFRMRAHRSRRRRRCPRRRHHLPHFSSSAGDVASGGGRAAYRSWHGGCFVCVTIAYERLSGLDEAFLAFETQSAYMHVAVTAIFATGPLSGASGGVALHRIRRHVESRLDRLPRFRQRLAFVPLVRRACWVDDARFDLAYHVRHVSLPRPGTDEQLRQRSAEILERQLSRDRPLWEIWVIEGLADDRFALVVKVHHCIVDGVGGVGVLANLLSLDAAEPDAPTR